MGVDFSIHARRCIGCPGAPRECEEELIETRDVPPRVFFAHSFCEFIPPDLLKPADFVVRDFHALDDTRAHHRAEGDRECSCGSEAGLGE
jgi:hypothetical protein